MTAPAVTRPVPDAGEPAPDVPTVSRAATGMGVVAGVSRLFGAARVLLIATILGTTYLGNAFQAANTFSTVLFELLAAGALSAVLVPPFVRWFEHREEREAERVAGELLGLALVVLGALSLVGVLVAPTVADLLTSGVDDPTIAAAQQDLTTTLLRWFIPQIVLYGIGAIATAVLHAKRVFTVPAAAPIGNTVVLGGFLIAFRLVAGPDPGLDLTGGEVLLLALGGTLGVAAFVAIPTVALVRGGFRFVPRRPGRDPALVGLLRSSGWASVQHLGAGLLLAAALVVGGGVEGGVVAFQVGWVFFQAPYGILAQPIHTAILPEISLDAAEGDLASLMGAVRWALDNLALLLVPLSAAAVVLAVPALEAVAFGGATAGEGGALLGAAVASLSVGLFGYGSFLLLARAFYTLGDSRTPALVGLGGALAGVAAMVGLAPLSTGVARVVLLGLVHSAVFTGAAMVAAVILGHRTGQSAWPRLLLPVATSSVVLAAAAAGLLRLWAPSGRPATALAVVVIGAGVTGGFLLVRKVGWLRSGESAPRRRGSGPAVEAVAS